MSASGTVLLRRVAHEYRRTLIILAVLALGNIVLYASFVYPLAQRVANIEQRDQAAERELAAAKDEHDQAAGTLTGKDRAGTELSTFYQDVLPADLPGARRMTHLRLPQLARQSKLQFERSVNERTEERDSTLSRLRTRMILSGSYAAVRAFVHQLDTAPEFVIIDNVSLAEDDVNDGSLVVTLDLSTYYRDTVK